MQLSAVTLARVFAFIESVDINSRGRVHFPELGTALVKRYQFLKFPQNPDDYDEAKGVLFDGGKFGEIGGIRLQVFSYGIVVDTQSSTEDCDRLLEEALVWGATEHGLTYKPGMIKRRAYLSQLTFHSTVDFLALLNPALLKLAEKVTKQVPQYFGQKVEYTPTAFSIGFDALTVKATPAHFTVERRVDIPFSENKYFSMAPLPTDRHIAFLGELEGDVLRNAPPKA